ncbi:response regulator transcription factor [Streptomyces sp. UNOC14_S4]|uniref:response regulator transcription factor n=1 Tax=Streptomyces sp. UNOC14_S4 TaxID=2872340 RepID=UPI001E2ECC60|nr:response regulator transcription factor [Streptomyces sp. UNOC14_S4]MCC3771628.1 response regulator transcription factor [Streptomyces sp. UNOC14_S4]
MTETETVTMAMTVPATVCVLIADDEEITRTGLRTLLSAWPGIQVTGEAADGVEAVALAERLRPDVVLMDVRMPGVDGIEATRRLRQSAPPDPPKVVVITTFENDDHVYDALRAGAAGFVLKRSPVEQIAQAVRLVATTDSVLFPDAVRRLVAARPVPPRPPRGAPALTARELEILRLMATGLSNPGIAERLVVSLETVKTHISNLLAKLGAGNRTQAVILAYECGFVVPGAGPVPP